MPKRADALVHDALVARDLLADELIQRRQAGFDIGKVEALARQALDDDGTNDADLEAHLDAVTRTVRRPDWRYTEVDSADELLARAELEDLQPRPVRPSELSDRIHGAWLGRCAGCLLGKPVEGWAPGEIHEYLRRAGAWPLEEYLPRLVPYPGDLPSMKPSWVEATRGAIQGMPRDDDLDYTVVALLALERTGGRPTADDVAAELLRRLPIDQVFTAERAAYRNLVHGLRPPLTAAVRNPYREWIGALIRVDAYAYASPGDPMSAVGLAAVDASVSHVGNGIAAAMWAAAVISQALAGVVPEESVPRAVVVVPTGSRLREVLDLVVALHRDGRSADEAFAELRAVTDDYGWVHAIPNTAIIAASLLWGEGDFGRSISLAVAAGHDTDSNGATVGSAAGALIGRSGLPGRWTDPLGDVLRTSVAGEGTARISQLAARTVRLAAASNESLAG